MRLVYKKNKKIRLICAFCWAFFHWRDWRWHLDIKKGLHFGSHIQFFVLVSSGHLCENLLTAPRSACSCRPGSSNLAQPSRVGFSSQRHSGVCPLLPIRIGAWADHTPWRWTAGKAWFVGCVKMQLGAWGIASFWLLSGSFCNRLKVTPGKKVDISSALDDALLAGTNSPSTKIFLGLRSLRCLT